MKQKIFMLLAAVLLSSASTFAQSGNNEPLKGDVNGDGKVDVADIAAVIKIMKDGGGTSEEPKYYWYIGQTNPANMSSIDPIVSDTSSPGWRLIGTNVPDYSSSNMLWDGDNNNIIFANRDYYYVAVPKQTIQLYNVANGSVMEVFTTSTTTINGVTYYIYSCINKARAFGYNIY